MPFHLIFIAIFMALISTGCTEAPPGFDPVTNFEIERYLGKWYEIARLDHSFERDMINVSAVYEQDPKGGIQVTNKGYDTDSNEWKTVKGRAKFIDDKNVGSLKVSFFGPFYGGYHIIAIDREHYGHAMIVGHRSNYFWILSRTPWMEDAIYRELVNRADALGIDTDALIRVPHIK
jgi:apolipoprotein D and lipocalin family protein